MTPIWPLSLHSKACAHPDALRFIRQQSGGTANLSSAQRDRTGRRQPASARMRRGWDGASHALTSARNAKEVHDAMTQPTDSADSGDLLSAFSVSAALAQRAIGAAREAARG